MAMATDRKAALLLIVLLTTLFLKIAAADIMTDCSFDLEAYRETVAKLNLQLVRARDDQTGGSVMLLCRITQPILDTDDAPSEPMHVVYGPYGYTNIVLASEAEAEPWLMWLKEQPGVLCAERDQQVNGCSENQTQTFSSWGAQAMEMGAYTAYAAAHGSGSVTVAVIDSGMFRHPLLRPRVVGYGYDYVDADEDPGNDLNGHGTHVAGIIVDCTPGLPVYLYPIRVLDASARGTLSNVISAVLEAGEAGASLINLSLNTPVQSELLKSAVRQAVASGIAVVAAAGNDAEDAAEFVPAGMPDAGVIVVGSVESNGSRSAYSNYGASVDVYAYGSEIVSCSRTGGLISRSGTSQAAPHITALCAMLRMIHPGLSPGQLELRLKAAEDTATGIAAPKAMIPTDYPFALRAFGMDVGDRLQLGTLALPESAGEAIGIESSAPEIAAAEDGVLIARAAGTACLTISCTGLDAMQVEVTVEDTPHGTYTLPAAVTEVAWEAFLGNSSLSHLVIPSGVTSLGSRALADCGRLRTISVPDTLTEIGDNDLSQTVLLCTQESPVLAFAAEGALQYILTGEQ